METVNGNEKTLGPKFKEVLYIVAHKISDPESCGESHCL